MKNKIYIVTILFLVLTTGFFVYKYQLCQKNTTITIPNSVAIVNTGIPPPRTAQAGFKEYRHLTYHFSLFYPDNLLVREFKEKGTALTVTFQDKEGRSFQIFVVPYGEEKISERRFKIDIPSGIITEPVDIMIDGIRATKFFSQNKIMGETREIWFVKGGFLYEITTYKELDIWLSSIMQTWKFF